MYETEKREVTITTWVSNAFNEKYNYSFLSEKRKIKKSEIDAEQIDYAAKLNKISANKLKAEILAQKVNRIFTYRAEWREDLMQIVYIPSLKKFVCFTRGY
jgi:ABC-type bacteriocin/lantibiotic exporter with double-glycine peptidase domain